MFAGCHYDLFTGERSRDEGLKRRTGDPVGIRDIVRPRQNRGRGMGCSATIDNRYIRAIVRRLERCTLYCD